MRLLKSFSFYIALFVSPLLFSSTFAQKIKKYDVSEADIKYYLDLNEKEKRLSDYKDDKRRFFSS